MSLKTKIDKAAYDKLADHLKTEYIPDGEGYKLDADYEDVTGLKAKNSELLGKLTDAQKIAKQFEGLDPDEIKAKLDALSARETEELQAKGKWEELETKLREKHAEESAKLAKKLESIVAANAEKELQLKLVAAGVKENLAEDLAISLRARNIKHVEDGGKIIWKTLDDTETVDLDKYIPSLKESKADYFKADMGSGSGSGGSDFKGGTADMSSMNPMQKLDIANAATTK